MNIKKTQQGMTFLGIMVIISVAIFLGLLVLRLLPVYSDDFVVSKSLDILRGNGEDTTREENMKKFGRQLDMNNITRIKPNELTLEPRGSGFLVKLDYEVRVPIIYNVDAVVKFSHQREIP